MKFRILAGAASAALVLAVSATPTVAAQGGATTDTATASRGDDDNGFDEWGLLGLLGLAGLIPRKRKDDHRTNH